MSIWKFLGQEKEKLLGETEPNKSSPETETVRKIVHALDAMDTEQARYIAAFAYLLSRVARADMNISDKETYEMERLVQVQGGLSEEQAILVVQMAKTQNRLFGGTEDFLVTREFNKFATHEQKLAVLTCLYAVSAADQSISTIEDNEISQTAKELFLSHKDLVAARSKYRKYLAVLKKPSANS
ncbi:MAG TPA: TerB family tellurite resistance protein [Terriglobia bacterium]|nr:TerB family tellurite resistance protein [Terriglobia bacterium]